MAETVRTVTHFMIVENPDKRPIRPLHMSIP